MATAPGPLLRNVAPKAEAPEIGIIVSSDPQNPDETDRWLNGVTYLPEGCIEGQTHDPCDVGEQDDSEGPESVAWHTYNLTLIDPCSNFSGEWDQRQLRVERALIADEERQVGSELWDGTLAQARIAVDSDYPNTWLTNEDTLDNLTEAGPVGLVHGLACLDNYLLTHNGGQQGMIHATGQAFVHWASFRMLRWVGNRVLSPLNNIVVASPGYSGNSPLGVKGDDDIWAYATDKVQVRLGKMKSYDVATAGDIRQNNYPAKAERPALAEWPRCRHAGVQLALSECDTSGS